MGSKKRPVARCYECNQPVQITNPRFTIPGPTRSEAERLSMRSTASGTAYYLGHRRLGSGARCPASEMQVPRTCMADYGWEDGC